MLPGDRKQTNSLTTGQRIKKMKAQKLKKISMFFIYSIPLLRHILSLQTRANFRIKRIRMVSCIEGYHVTSVTRSLFEECDTTVLTVSTMICANTARQRILISGTRILSPTDVEHIPWLKSECQHHLLCEDDQPNYLYILVYSPVEVSKYRTNA